MILGTTELHFVAGPTSRQAANGRGDRVPNSLKYPPVPNTNFQIPSPSPSNQPIQFPDHLSLTLAAFLTRLQMINQSRQVQPIAQLNAQVIEVFAAGELERDHL
jgi:hypothetical protein